LAGKDGSIVVFDRALLADFVRERALKYGNFTLRSGRKARYFLDAKQVTLDARGAKMVGEAVLELLQAPGKGLPKAVGGMAIGADPVTAAVVTMAGVFGLPLSGFLVRPERKDRGTEQFIEGPVLPGDEVVVLEDVVTTGGAMLEAIARCREFGLVVRSAVAIVDRLAGAEAAFAAVGVPFQSLLTIRDLGLEPEPT
jgi:orotate phosphoribosyltransferase